MSEEMKILVVDDDATSREIIAAVLEESHSVVRATSGEEAWSIIQDDSSIVLAIIDQLMPGISGLELAEKIRNTERPVPLYTIMLTALDDPASLQQGFAAGVDDYMTKPFSPAELTARLHVGLRTVALEQRLEQKVKDLETALERVKMLEGIIPICSFCKKVRDDSKYWNSVEEYIGSHLQAQFSHGVCPDCARIHYGIEEL